MFETEFNYVFQKVKNSIFFKIVCTNMVYFYQCFLCTCHSISYHGGISKRGETLFKQQMDFSCTKQENVY